MARIRDFQESHPDFRIDPEALGVHPGLVQERLAGDKPLASVPWPVDSGPPLHIDEWYADLAGVNVAVNRDIVFAELVDAPGILRFSSSPFFPIDGDGFENGSRPDGSTVANNTLFTTEIHGEFVYQGGETIRLGSDDDAWVFVNGHLLIDQGGEHGKVVTNAVSIDTVAGDFGMVRGGTYRIDIFHADRAPTTAALDVQTTIRCIRPRGDPSGLPSACQAPMNGAPPKQPTCSVQAPDVDYCSEIPALPGQPVIDGEVDCGVMLRTIEPMGWTGIGDAPVVSARYAVAWRSNGLYFFLQVRDASRVPPDPTGAAWRGDGVELYVDDDGKFPSAPQYGASGTRQIDIPAAGGGPQQLAEIYASGSLVGTWSPGRYATKMTSDGYAVEAFVQGAELGMAWNLVPGQRVGMNVGINASFPCPERIGSYSHLDGNYVLRLAPATGAQSRPYQNTNAFCTPVLTGP